MSGVLLDYHYSILERNYSSPFNEQTILTRGATIPSSWIPQPPLVLQSNDCLAKLRFYFLPKAKKTESKQFTIVETIVCLYSQVHSL